MYVKTIVLLASAAALVLPTAARADYAHIALAGESLNSIARADGLSVNALAVANGLSDRAELTVGQVIEIPPLDSYTAPGRTAVSSSVSPSTLSPSVTPSGAYVVQPGDTLSAIAARAGTSVADLAAQNGLHVDGLLIAGARLVLPSGAGEAVAPTTEVSDSTSAGAGSYVVAAGDSLSAIAARAGTSVDHLAALNGLSPNGVVLIGTKLTLPAGSATLTSSTVSSAATGPGNQQVSADTSGGPYPTPERVSGSEISGLASADGVDPAFAEAIGWQESGYDNDLVSSTGAVGVMQIEPATWSWINQVLTPGALLDPVSAYDNVKGGVLLLHDLVAQTGSDATAAAAYYQGLGSVEANGLYPETQQYVRDVTALQERFGR